MPEETERESFLSMKRTLEEIKALLLIINQEKLSTVKKDLLKQGSIKLQIYELCDGSKTNRDIATAIQKDESYVRSYITRLRREGFIITDSKTGHHSQIF